MRVGIGQVLALLSGLCGLEASVAAQATACAPHAVPVGAATSLEEIAALEKRGEISAGDALKAREAIAGKALDEMLTRAPAAKVEIDSLAHRIAAEYGGRVVTAAIKGRPRALEKILADYAGDASRIKDLARNTIVVDEAHIPAVVARLEALGAKTKVIKRTENPLGYGGINTTLPTKSGLTAEMQISTPEMIFARTRPEKARAILGSETYDKIARKVGLPGGLGHELYEAWRALPPDSPRAAAIAAESRAYYANFR